MLTKYQQPKINEEAIMLHYRELAQKKPTPKHVLYNRLLRVFKLSGVKVSTLNNTTIITTGILNNMMFRPDGVRCMVFIGYNKAYGTSKITMSYDFVVDYSITELLVKMLYHEIITDKVYKLLLLNAARYA
jgi:hypothetical protein